jgi:hypothetical protein
VDDSTVTQAAQTHADATVAGDMKTAGSFLDRSAYGAAGEVMKAMPEPLEASEVTTVEAAGDGFEVKIRYSGGGAETTVLSTWSDLEGEPKIVGLQVL